MPSKVKVLKGDFTFQKSGWPKVEFPNISSGLIRDWWAEDLPLGPVDQWEDRIVQEKLVNGFPSSTTFVSPVVTDTDGIKSVEFNGVSQLQNLFVAPVNMSIAVVYNVSSAGGNAMRLVSGSEGFRFMSPAESSMVTQVATGSNTARVTLGTATAGGLVRDQWGASVLSHDNAKTLTAKVLGGNAVVAKIAAEPQPVEQNRFIVGYNSGLATVGHSSAYIGKVARVMIWNRALSQLDMDAVLLSNKKIFQLP